jgi:hypothetical protein
MAQVTAGRWQSDSKLCDISGPGASRTRELRSQTHIEQAERGT